LIQVQEDFPDRWLAIGILGWADHHVAFNEEVVRGDFREPARSKSAV
jgi:hypothetical protein